MTLRIKITHDQIDSEFAVVVGTLRADMTISESTFVEPGQTGEFHLWDGKNLILTEVPNGAHRAAQEAQAALNVAMADAELAAAGPLTAETADVLGTDIPSAPEDAPAAEAAIEPAVAE